MLCGQKNPLSRKALLECGLHAGRLPEIRTGADQTGSHPEWKQPQNSTRSFSPALAGSFSLFPFSPRVCRIFMGVQQRQVDIVKKKIETVCGFSCSDCDHHEKDCPGCEKVRGRPFWTAFVNIDQCPVYECCTTLKKLPRCGKCPELVCERFFRFRDPERTDEQAAAALAAAEKELRARG